MRTRVGYYGYFYPTFYYEKLQIYNQVWTILVYTLIYLPSAINILLYLFYHVSVPSLSIH